MISHVMVSVGPRFGRILTVFLSGACTPYSDQKGNMDSNSNDNASNSDDSSDVISFNS